MAPAHMHTGVDPSLPAAVAAARVRRLFPPRGGLRLLSREYLEGELPAIERVVVMEYVLDTLAALSSDRWGSRVGKQGVGWWWSGRTGGGVGSQQAQ